MEASISVEGSDENGSPKDRTSSCISELKSISCHFASKWQVPSGSLLPFSEPSTTTPQ